MLEGFLLFKVLEDLNENEFVQRTRARHAVEAVVAER